MNERYGRPGPPDEDGPTDTDTDADTARVPDTAHAADTVGAADTMGAAGPARAAEADDADGADGTRPDTGTHPDRTGEGAHGFDHSVLKSLLGAWALAACSAEETEAVEAHLTDCGSCADEALRLRDAVGLLHPEKSLDLDPLLRGQVLENCLDRRPARVPVPEWAVPYDAEAARLDALLRDMADAEWRAPVRLRWFDEATESAAARATTVAGVLAHLLAVDGLVAAALGLPEPRGADHDGARPPDGGPPAAASAGRAPGDSAGRTPGGPVARTEAYWRAMDPRDPDARRIRLPWRAQGHALVRTVSFAGGGTAGLEVSYGDGRRMPLRDAFLDRAFACWVHAGDIAEAVDYPYALPAGDHLHRMVDLAARHLPGRIAGRRRAGLAPPPRRLVPAGAPGRTLHLEVEGSGGGHWYIPLDSPAARPCPEEAVAHVALDRLEFCQLAAGHVPPQEAVAGQDGDREAIRDVLYAAASLSRL